MISFIGIIIDNRTKETDLANSSEFDSPALHPLHGVMRSRRAFYTLRFLKCKQLQWGGDDFTSSWCNIPICTLHNNVEKIVSTHKNDADLICFRLYPRGIG